MMDAGHIENVLILLLAAIVTVPLLQRLRASPVLGYLAAGIAVGPHGWALIPDTAAAQGIAEFGVIFLLFTIGLDLPLQRVRAMWRYIFGLGAAQVGLTSLLIGLVAYTLGINPEAALVIGGALALSSTATVLQLMRERGELASRFGRISIAVLLFQDLAVVPLLAILPLLQAEGGTLAAALGLALVKAVFAVAAILLIGRVVLRPIFRWIASSRNAEVFAAANLLVVLGMGWATAQFGMSMALGAFLAGLMLAETEFRHQVEADIQPFRGIFLGLFFITVGMLIDLSVVAENALVIGGTTIAVLAGKAVVITGLCWLFGLNAAISARIGLSLAQCGEFAFVIFGFGMQLGVIPEEIGLVLIPTVALTMAATPLLTAAGGHAARAISSRTRPEIEQLAEDTVELSDHIIVAGFGRVGQTIGKLLAARGIPYVAIDADMRLVHRARKDGFPLYFGDASRAEVLHAAGLERASGAVITLDQPAAAERVVSILRQQHPRLAIVARSRDVEHGARLQRAGATVVIPEALEPGLQMAAAALRAGGAASEEIDAALSSFRKGTLADIQHPRP